MCWWPGQLSPLPCSPATTNPLQEKDAEAKKDAEKRKKEEAAAASSS